MDEGGHLTTSFPRVGMVEDTVGGGQISSSCMSYCSLITLVPHDPALK